MYDLDLTITSTSPDWQLASAHMLLSGEGRAMAVIYPRLSVRAEGGELTDDPSLLSFSLSTPSPNAHLIMATASSLLLPTTVTLAGLSLPYLGLYHFLQLPTSLALLPEPGLSLFALVVVSGLSWSWLKPLLINLTASPKARDPVDWIVANFLGCAFIGGWAWVLQTAWPAPMNRSDLEHETKKTEWIAVSTSAFVITAAVLNCQSNSSLIVTLRPEDGELTPPCCSLRADLRDEATPSNPTPYQIRQEQERLNAQAAAKDALVTSEDAEVLLTQD